MSKAKAPAKAAPAADDDGADEYADDFDPVCNMGHDAELSAQKLKIDALTAQIAALTAQLKLTAALASASAAASGVSAGVGTAAGGGAHPSTPLGRRRGADAKTGFGTSTSNGTGSGGGAGGLNLSDYRLREIPLKEVVVGEQIAGGGFCTLHRGTWQGITVAVKKIFDPVITAELKAEFQNECAMLSGLRHPNVVQILGACTVAPTLAIVMEFVPRGSLYHVLHQDHKLVLNNDRKRAIALQVAQALLFTSASGVVHRDIKSYNVLVNELLQCKLCDFGLARELALIQQSGTATGPASTSDKKAAADDLAGGTPAYLAPELWAKPPSLPSVASDVYAYGVLLHELWERAVPFDGYAVPDIRTKVLAGGRPTSDSPSTGSGASPFGLPKKPSLSGVKCNAQTENMPDAVVDLIAACWDAAPAKRPTFEKIVQTLSAIKL